MTFRCLSVALAACLFATPALAQSYVPGEEAAPDSEQPEQKADTPEEKAAVALTERYLKAVKAKKWNDAKKLLHPKTHEKIAERKKRVGREDHPMAPWQFAKDESWLKDFRITGARPGPSGTIVVETSEDNYQVQEKGVAEGEMASYLVGKKGGKLYMVDKKRAQSFTDDSILYGYKGWFDETKPASAKDE